MFGRPFRVGSLLGFSISLSWTFLLLVAILSLNIAVGSSNFFAGLLLGLGGVALLFGSVLLHELGHSLVARRLGVKVKDIELHFFGGAAKLASLPRSPRDEALIALAGPAVSLTIGMIAALAAVLTSEPLGLLWLLAGANLMLGLFNLLPALPMDGGRILRAVLTPRYGKLRATRIAVGIARVVALGLGIWALVSGHFFAVAVAVFIWILATQELRQTAALDHRREVGDYEVLGADGRVIARYHSDESWHGNRPGATNRQVEPIRVVIIRGSSSRP